MAQFAVELESFRRVFCEEELHRTKWFKEDLDIYKGDRWSVTDQGPGYTYWIKTIYGDEVPIKKFTRQICRSPPMFWRSC